LALGLQDVAQAAGLSTDISTGKTFTGQLSAADGSTVVTPLTTIIDTLAGNNASAAQIAAAEMQVKTALGLDSSVNLSTYDPIAVASQSTDSAALANAVAVQKAAVQIANILTVVASASEAAGVTGGPTHPASIDGGSAGRHERPREHQGRNQEPRRSPELGRPRPAQKMMFAVAHGLSSPPQVTQLPSTWRGSWQIFRFGK